MEARMSTPAKPWTESGLSDEERAKRAVSESLLRYGPNGGDAMEPVVEAFAAHRALAPWTRFSAALPPDDGSLFEVRFDNAPGRFFISRHRVASRVGDYMVLPRLHTVVWGRDAESPGFALTMLNRNEITPDTRGWWRLLPADDPPPAPEE
jgi:hypothetical protein